MGSLWQITRNEDGTFTFLQDDRIQQQAIPERWLEEQIARYGLTGQEFRDLKKQLEANGMAELDLQ